MSDIVILKLHDIAMLVTLRWAEDPASFSPHLCKRYSVSNICIYKVFLS